VGALLLLFSLFSYSLTPPGVPASPEKQLLDLVNQARAEAQLPPLEWDAGLARAAQAHAMAMAAAHELTHQLKNEASMPARLTAATTLRLDAEGENVALNTTISGAHEGLMHSPPHRENILDPHFNYAGFAVVWDKGQLWVVQDFAHAMREYSANAAEDMAANAIVAHRQNAGLPALVRVRIDGLHEAACGMGQADSVQTSATRELGKKYNVVTYTQTDPSVFTVSKLAERPDIRNFAVAVCFARTKSYEGGVYWVIALFY
jgi:Cysteine-rich secretory protein family